MDKVELVQIAPGAHPTWGGQPLRVVRQLEGGQLLKGYILVPHRGGGREAWITVPRAATRRIGTLRWNEDEWLSREGKYNAGLEARPLS